MLTRLTTLVVALAMARPVAADPVANFKRGTSLRLHKATVNTGADPLVTTEIPLQKAQGTLDITLIAKDFGLPGSLTLRLRGAAVSKNQLRFTVDDNYKPSIAIGGGLVLTRITGVLTATATWLPGDASAAYGNVQLRFHDSSYLVAHGSWGTRTIPVTNTRVVGGLVQPPLEAFTTVSRVCSNTTPTMLPLTVRLAGPARLDAAPVALSTPASAIRVPQIAGVPLGQRATIVRAKIPANYVGPARFVAASGGVKRTLDVSIRPRQDCEVRP
jgi:hypothetical protein